MRSGKWLIDRINSLSLESGSTVNEPSCDVERHMRSQVAEVVQSFPCLQADTVTKQRPRNSATLLIDKVADAMKHLLEPNNPWNEKDINVYLYIHPSYNPTKTANINTSWNARQPHDPCLACAMPRAPPYTSAARGSKDRVEKVPYTSASCTGKPCPKWIGASAPGPPASGPLAVTSSAS